MSFQGENRHGYEFAYMKSGACSEEFQVIHSRTMKKRFCMLPCFHILEILIVMVAYYDYAIWQNGCQNRIS